MKNRFPISKQKEDARNIEWYGILYPSKYEVWIITYDPSIITDLDFDRRVIPESIRRGSLTLT